MSSVHRYRSTWRSLTFNQVYDNSGVTDDPAHLDEDYANSDFRLDSWDATRVESQDYRELRQWLEGAEANEAYEGVMVALGSGIIIASSYADLEDKTQLLRSQFSIASCRLAAEATTRWACSRSTSGGPLPSPPATSTCACTHGPLRRGRW